VSTVDTIAYIDAGPLHLSHVNAAPFAEVLNDCRKRYSLRQLSVATGISRYELTRISLGEVSRIRRSTADTLRAVLPALLPSEVFS
jgi:DNA-binding Xre family transcriptional regulator